MHHVVFLVGRYYPLFSAPGECAKKLIDEIKNECKVTVVAIQTHGYSESKQVEHEGVIIRYVSNWRNDLRVLVTDWKNQGKHKSVSMLEPVVRVLNGLAAIFFIIARDGWYKNKGYRELVRIHHRDPIDVVVSVSFPFGTHLAAWKFTRRFPEVQWITYSVDTLCNNPGVIAYSAYKAIKPWLNRILETKTLSASGHNFITPEIAQSCQELLARVSASTTVLNYMMPRMQQRASMSRFFSSGKCHVLCGGALYKNIRTPEHMLNVFSRITNPNIILHMFVRVGACAEMVTVAKKNMGERMQIHEIVTPTEFKFFLLEADILINLENNLNNSFPSKVFEYFASGKPIVSFKYQEQPISPMIKRYPCLLQLENFGDANRDARAVEEFCLSRKGQRLPDSEIYACYPEHTPEHVAREFRTVLFSKG